MEFENNQDTIEIPEEKPVVSDENPSESQEPVISDDAGEEITNDTVNESETTPSLLSMVSKKTIALIVVAVVAILAIIFSAIGIAKNTDNDSSKKPSSTQKVTTTTKKKTTTTRKTTTTQRLDNADLIEYIGDRSIQYNEDDKKFILFFALKDADHEFMSADGDVAIEITNNNGESVYSKTVQFYESDFSMWTSASYGEQYMLGIDIHTADITPGTIKSGKISYKVTLSNGMWFQEGCEHTISDNLPVKSTAVVMPTLPITLHEYDYNDNLERTVIVTDMRYEIDSYGNLKVYFSGEKTFDEEGDNHGHSAYISYTLYDSEGYVVASGTFSSPNLRVGQKFRDEEETIYGVDIIPGESYTLEVISTVE